MKLPRHEMTAEIANKFLRYCPETGYLYRKYKYHNNVIAGKRACAPCHNKFQDHLTVPLCGCYYPAHRIIWLMIYGKWPDGHIDHLDHDEMNNRLNNLRDVPQSENNRNSSKRCDNTAGVTGIWINSKNTYKKFMAEIRDPFSKKICKSFYTMEEAVHQRKLWEKEFGYHKNHGIIKPE